MPTWSDKLLAEVMRMILDAYFDGNSVTILTVFDQMTVGRERSRADLSHTWKGLPGSSRVT